jgi:hypothetical protein
MAAASSSSKPDEPTVEIDGTTYTALADGEYDYIILGTGLKECILAGMLAASRQKKVRLVNCLPQAQEFHAARCRF